MSKQHRVFVAFACLLATLIAGSVRTEAQGRSILTMQIHQVKAITECRIGPIAWGADEIDLGAIVSVEGRGAVEERGAEGSDKRSFVNLGPR